MTRAKLGTNPKQNALSGFKLLSRDSGSRVPYEIHVRMLLSTTRDCKQYFKQLITQNITWEFTKTGGGVNANGRFCIFGVSNDYVKKVVPERKHCVSGKCHISDIDIDKLSFKNPGQDELLPATPSQAPLCISHSRCHI